METAHTPHDTVVSLVRQELSLQSPTDLADIHEGLGLIARIEHADGYVWVAEAWKRLKVELKRRTDYFRGEDETGTSRVGRAYRVYQDWLDAEHESIDGLKASIAKAALLLGQYDTAQREKAEAESRRLAAEAQKKADEEQLEAAIFAEADGAVEEAAEIMATPAVAAPVQVRPSTPLVADMTTQGRWKAKLAIENNIDKLILAAADEIRHKKPRIAVGFLKHDQVSINRAATNMKANLKAIGATLGLYVWEDITPRST